MCHARSYNLLGSAYRSRSHRILGKGTSYGRFLFRIDYGNIEIAAFLYTGLDTGSLKALRVSNPGFFMCITKHIVSSSELFLFLSGNQG